jgi:hypothetical protein
MLCDVSNWVRPRRMTFKRNLPAPLLTAAKHTSASTISPHLKEAGLTASDLHQYTVSQSFLSRLERRLLFSIQSEVLHFIILAMSVVPSGHRC